MPNCDESDLDQYIEGAARTLAAIAPRLPTLESAQSLKSKISPAIKRGYLLPDEDELIRDLFSRYLTIRAALLSVLGEVRPYAYAEVRNPTPKQPDVFLIAFCAACLLVRSGRYVVESVRNDPVIWKKLDEPEPRFGIPRKQFTKIYRSLASTSNIWAFLEGIRYFQEHRTELMALESNPSLKPIVEIIRVEESFINSSRSYYATHGAKYRWHSLLRRHHSGFKKFTFGLFRISGSVIAEMRLKWKRKRVTPTVQRKISRLLQPGDTIITRHDDAASNLFLPGFWPHGALYIGTEHQRQQLEPGVAASQLDPCEDPNSVLEARKDGVLFRPLHDTLDVDACVVLRPKLCERDIRIAIKRAMAHQGKPYDFEFDFRRSDKLVCTEVIYRAFHGVGGIQFELKTRAGRVCLTAEDLLDHAINGEYFEVLFIYGSKGNRFVSGKRARMILVESYRSQSSAGSKAAN